MNTARARRERDRVRARNLSRYKRVEWLPQLMATINTEIINQFNMPPRTFNHPNLQPRTALGIQYLVEAAKGV